MRILYDRQARAAYIYVQDGVAIASTTQLGEYCLVDSGPSGQLVGVEILDVDEPTVEDIARPEPTG